MLSALFAQAPQAPAATDVMAQIMAMIYAMMFVIIALVVFSIICGWVIFEKAGKPGWASLVPIYNTIVFLEICGKPAWWIILLIIPCTAPFVAIYLMFPFAKSFGQGAGFALGLIFLGIIFVPLLAFGGYKYVGPPRDY